MITLQCASCGNDFTVKSYRKKQRFCSIPCATKRAPPAWHHEAKKLKAQGMINEKIAKLLGVSSGSVSYAVNESCRANQAKRKRKAYDAERGQAKRAIIKRWTGPNGQESATCYFEAHKYRKPAEVIDREAVMPAAKLFAAGKISRAELMARITPR